MLKRIKSVYVIIGALLLAFVVNAWMSWYSPLTSDDLAGATQAVLGRTYWDWFNWNGRSIGQFFFRLLTHLPMWAEVIANGLVFMLLIFLGGWLTSKTKFGLAINISSFFILTWLYTPAYFETFVWRAGSGNYMWTLVIMLVYLVPFIKKGVYDRFSSHILLSSVYMLAFGIFAGWGNENTSGGAILIAGLFSIWYLLSGQGVKSWQITGIVGQIIGFGMLVLAPANSIRAATVHGSALDFEQIKHAIDMINQALAKNHTELLVLLALVFGLAIGRRLTTVEILPAMIFILAGFATIYVLALSPVGYTGGRSFFGGTIFWMMALLSVLPTEWTTQERGVKWLMWIVSGFVIVRFMMMFTIGMQDMIKADDALKARYATIERAVKKGGHNQIVSVPKLEYASTTMYGPMHPFDPLKSDYKMYPNIVYELYFRVEGVVPETPNDRPENWTDLSY